MTPMRCDGDNGQCAGVPFHLVLWYDGYRGRRLVICEEHAARLAAVQAGQAHVLPDYPMFPLSPIALISRLYTERED